MPRKTRTRWLLRTLGRVEEDRECPKLRDSRALGLEVCERTELRHHGVAELRRVGNVGGEPFDPAASLPDRRKIRCPRVRGPRAEVGMARRASGVREDVRTGDGLLVVLEALALGPARHSRAHFARQRLLCYGT